MIMKFRSSERTYLGKLIRNAVILRLIVLILIACSGNWEQSFIGQGVTDDWKYEVGAVLFEQNASSLFDVGTFAWAFNSLDATDWTGYHLHDPIGYSVFWYLIVCILVWVFKTKYAIRLFNIFLFAVSMKYIYNFANKIWGEKVADKATKLFAYLPYPVVFCCFGYKEELALFCTFYLLSNSVDIRTGVTKTPIDYIKMILVALLQLGIRSGITLIFIGVCVVIMFVPDLSLGTRVRAKNIVPFLAIIIISIFAVIRFGDSILYKANAYLTGRTGSQDTISFLLLNKITDVWKLPFSYMFSIIMPISLFRSLNSWVSLIDSVNICMVPISVGAFFYLIFQKKPDKNVYWGTLAYYLIYVITSLSIFRQYAALLPLNLIYFSAFIVNSDKSKIRLMYIGSAAMAFALIVFYLL